MAEAAGAGAMGMDDFRGNRCLRVATHGLARVFFGRLKPLAEKYDEDEDLMEKSVASKDETPATSEPEECSETPSVVTRTVYLVRHGEAVHNVLENEAKKRAAAEAEALGHSKGSEAYNTMVEMARKAVLHDATQVDPPLSQFGIEQARMAKAHLEWLTSGPLQLPEPAEVLVSPLQRTLQTAAAMFPDHPNVRVNELVRERRTGLACDEPSPPRDMCQRKCFSYFDFGSILPDGLQRQDSTDDALHTAGRFSADPRRTHSEANTGNLEDAAALRVRTAMLGQLLGNVEDEAVCVVTHKGYLRELERGPLGAPEATQFDTCEVRVYEVAVSPDGSMDATLRYRKDLHGDGGVSVDGSASKA